MKIEKLEWRNIFSYGNKGEELYLGDSGKLWQLSGKSGAGKSSFLSIPKLLFYGKTDGFKVGDIANRVNKNGWIRGTVRVGQDVFVIERKFSPQGLSITKNGEVIDKAGAKDMQGVIDTEIMNNMPYNIYSNIMSLSLNNFKSFISMTPSDKRTIIDKIFSLEIINYVFELIKKDKRDLGNLINNSNSQLFSLDRSLKQSEQELETLRGKEIASDHNAMIASIDAKIHKVDEISCSQTSSYNECTANYNNILCKENEIRTLFNELNNELRTVNDKISLLNSDKCPTCGTSFHSSDFDEIRNALSSKKESLMETITSYNDTLAAIAASKNEHLTAIAQYQTNLNTLSSKRNELLIERKGIESSTGIATACESVKRLIETTKKDKAQVERDLLKSNNDMNLLEIMEMMYSSDGIKQEMMNAYIPTLNEEIKDTLEFLHFPYVLEFDNNFNPHLEYFGESVEVSTLSTGEHKKVDLAVLCSILKMIKRKYPQINLVCLDETLSSLDYESSTDVILYLREIASTMNLNIFIVSHTMLDENLFDEKIFVENLSGFTDFHYICNTKE
jgi:DNA repair exonuclease SbcCD ATPase subunit